MNDTSTLQLIFYQVSRGRKSTKTVLKYQKSLDKQPLLPQIISDFCRIFRQATTFKIMYEELHTLKQKTNRNNVDKYSEIL